MLSTDHVVCRNSAATHEAINSSRRLCTLVTQRPDHVQEWLSGCEQQYKLLAGGSIGWSSNSKGGRATRRLGEAAAAAIGPAQQPQLQALRQGEQEAHVQPNELRIQHTHQQATDLRSDAVFSHFEWKDPCDSSEVISAPIEPLIGHFRCGVPPCLCPAAATWWQGTN